MWFTITSTEQWLSRLAAEYLGSPMDYLLIYEENKDVFLQGPDKVQIGMKFWIPIGGEPRPDISLASAPTISAPSTGTVPAPAGSIMAALKEGGQNKVLIAGGIGLGIIAIFMLMSPKKI